MVCEVLSYIIPLNLCNKPLRQALFLRLSAAVGSEAPK